MDPDQRFRQMMEGSPYKGPIRFKATPELVKAINGGIQPYPIPADVKYTYGTAGVSGKCTQALDILLIKRALSFE